MANTINYAEKYMRELDQMIQQQSVTADLETPNVNWLDAVTFKMPTLTVGGYKPHSRNGGFNRGDVDVTHATYTLDFDRDVEFFVDRADVDESNQAASAANLTNVFMSENGVPEMDAYRLSKLATTAIDAGNTTSEELTSENVFESIKRDLLKVRKYGPSNVTIKISSEAMDLLERSAGFQRNISVETGEGMIDTRVTSIDGVRVQEVWDDARMWTEYDFSDGFEPETGALKINFLIVARPAVIAKAKFNSVYLFQPGDHTQGDGFLYQNRMYHDLFVMDGKEDAVYVSTVETP